MSKPLREGLHTSRMHVTHNIPDCGCALDESEPVVTCPCGAAYLFRVVATFPIFRCYDCGRAEMEPGLEAEIRASPGKARAFGQAMRGRFEAQDPDD